ncbi:site-specific integrase [Methanobrevibacter sp.]|uniref:site-specific integrase n=1 Tax=Methanobrevibacter sp. TaxID=66852 RepID=UPI003863870D
MALSRNLAERTERLYRDIIEKYTRFFKTPLTVLLKEAETEEDQKISWKKRKLRKRLLEFRQYLYNNYMMSTAKMNFSKILTIYRHYEIELYKLPPISGKQCEETHIQFKDLPDREIIREALKLARPIHRAIILFMSSSGCATAETLNLRISDLLKSVEEYYSDSDNVYDMIQKLQDRDDIVPIFQLKRKKTGKLYYTFCTPEAFHEICMYLIQRKGLRSNDRLFKITQLHLMQLFREVNNLLGLGTVGPNNYVRFRSHMLRKFHASTLYNDGMILDDVNDLQGKTKNKTDSSYFMEDPNKLKQKYVQHMGALAINLEVNSLDIKSKEYVLLERELESKSREYDDLKNRISCIEQAINSNISSNDLALINKYI